MRRKLRAGDKAGRSTRRTGNLLVANLEAQDTDPTTQRAEPNPASFGCPGDLLNGCRARPSAIASSQGPVLSERSPKFVLRAL